MRHGTPSFARCGGDAIRKPLLEGGFTGSYIARYVSGSADDHMGS